MISSAKVRIGKKNYESKGSEYSTYSQDFQNPLLKDRFQTQYNLRKNQRPVLRYLQETHLKPNNIGKLKARNGQDVASRCKLIGAELAILILGRLEIPDRLGNTKKNGQFIKVHTT